MSLFMPAISLRSDPELLPSTDSELSSCSSSEVVRYGSVNDLSEEIPSPTLNTTTSTASSFLYSDRSNDESEILTAYGTVQLTPKTSSHNNKRSESREKKMPYDDAYVSFSVALFPSPLFHLPNDVTNTHSPN